MARGGHGRLHAPLWQSLPPWNPCDRLRATGVAPEGRHFIHAMQQSLVLVTTHHDDFLDLHKIVQTARGTHPGILIVRNDPTRDRTPRHIVTAIAHLESTGVLLENQVYMLNHWR